MAYSTSLPCYKGIRENNLFLFQKSSAPIWNSNHRCSRKSVLRWDHFYILSTRGQNSTTEKSKQQRYSGKCLQKLNAIKSSPRGVQGTGSCINSQALLLLKAATPENAPKCLNVFRNIYPYYSDIFVAWWEKGMRQESTEEDAVGRYQATSWTSLGLGCFHATQRKGRRIESKWTILTLLLQDDHILDLPWSSSSRWPSDLLVEHLSSPLRTGMRRYKLLSS